MPKNEERFWRAILNKWDGRFVGVYNFSPIFEVDNMKSSSTPNNSKATARPPKVNINRNVYSKPSPPKSGAKMTPHKGMMKCT